MASISAIRDGIKARLATITGLRTYDVWPDQLHVPCVLVKPSNGTFRETLGGVPSARFELILLVHPFQVGIARGQDRLDPYLDDTGSQSIHAALRGDVTLGGAVHTCDPAGWRDYGVLEVNGVPYLGATIDLEVWA